MEPPKGSHILAQKDILLTERPPYWQNWSTGATKIRKRNLTLANWEFARATHDVKSKYNLAR